MSTETMDPKFKELLDYTVDRVKENCENIIVQYEGERYQVYQSSNGFLQISKLND